MAQELPASFSTAAQHVAHLFDEQGHPPRVLVQFVDKERVRTRHECLHDEVGLLARQRLRADRRAIVPDTAIDVARRDDDEQPRGVIQHVVEEAAARIVGPVPIVQQQHAAVVVVLDKQAQAALANVRCVTACCACRSKGCGKSLCSQQLAKGLEHRCEAIGLTAAAQARDAPARKLRGKLIEQPRLADTGRTTNLDHAALAVRLRAGLQQRGKQCVAPEKWRQAPRMHGVDTPSQAAQALHMHGAHRHGATGQNEVLDRARLEKHQLRA